MGAGHGARPRHLPVPDFIVSSGHDGTPSPLCQVTGRDDHVAGRHALVLGGYGLIGSAVMRALRRAGYRVTGIGRSKGAADAAAPWADWIIRDIPDIDVADWRRLTEGAALVVNAAGALQDSGRDDLEAIHVTAVKRLVAALDSRPIKLIQISAAGVSPTADTAFFRTKARGDAIVAQRAGDWAILRPTLVLSPDAYGGTALLRAAAGLPRVLPRFLPDAQVQTVHVVDVAAAVVACADGRVAAGIIADLTEPDARSLADLTARLRRWQGFNEPRFRPRVPDPVLTMAGRIADLLGHLGWRSPLRSTAIRALRAGVRGDPGPWAAAGGEPCRGLEESLARLPATRQERAFARLYLALPLAIATLSLVWLATGVIALCDIDAATAVLTGRGVSAWPATAAVLAGALADLALGAAILVRRLARRAALGMVALSLAYLGASLAVAPDLWGDPMGPMLKVLPGAVLALMVWLVLEER